MKRRSHDEWRVLFAGQEASGLSAAEFCQQNDLCPKHFSLRRKQLGWEPDKIGTGFVRAHLKRDLVDVVVAAPSSLVIHCSAGQLAFGVLPQPGWLAQLLKALA